MGEGDGNRNWFQAHKSSQFSQSGWEQSQGDVSRNGRRSWGCPSPEDENTVGRSEEGGAALDPSRGSKHSRRNRRRGQE
jgi:hypothetical protein